MSRRPKTAVERKARASELRSLSQVLRRHQVCSDTGPLESAANQCVRGTERDGWGYDVDSLIFQVRKVRGMRPRDVESVDVTLSARVRATFESARTHDAFEALNVNLEIRGRRVGAPDLAGAWHFDRHTGEDAKDSSGIHPLYHVQYGGWRMDEVELGGTLLWDVPRLLHPPLDAILAIDLTLANFLYDEWRRLRDEPMYSNLIDSMYRRLWHPWFEVVVGTWQTNAHLRAGDIAALCPALAVRLPS